MKNLTNESAIMLRELEVKYLKKKEPLIKISTSQSMNEAIHSIIDKDLCDYKEMFGAIYLNKRLEIIGWKITTIGSIDAVIAPTKEVFAYALKTLCSGIVIFHNHPSDNLEPSNADKDLTRKFIEVAKFHDMTIIDHIITTPSKKYYSFSDEGIL